MKKQIRNAWFSVTICGIALTGCSELPPDVSPDMLAVSEIRSAFDSGVPDAGSGTVAALAEPTGFATLKGKFTLDGDPPAKRALTITGNPEVCAPGGITVYDNDVVVDPSSKGFANVLIFADKVPEEWLHESAKPSEGEVLFDQKDCVFLTRVVTMKTSQILNVKNSDPIGHNLLVKNFNETIPGNKSTTYQPKKQDAVPAKMSCSIHPWMSAWFVARDNGYFAVTKPDGSFEIPNLPAGVKLDFKGWQERMGFIKGSIQVNGSVAKWKKGKFSLQLEPDGVEEMNVVLSATDL